MDGPSPATGPPEAIWLGGGVEAVFRLAGSVTGGRLSVVEHPMAPGSLIEPHTHDREDEYSYVLSGTLGMLLGDHEFEATTGMMVVKPSGVRHAAWNTGPEPARFLEIISPAGFERFFPEVAELFSRDTDPEADEFERLAAAYGLTFHMELVDDLVQRHGLTAAASYT